MNIEMILKENNIRSTKNRIAIMKVLEESEASVTAEYIFEKCKEKGQKVDLSTVYRTFDLLEEKDILNKFDVGEGKYNYILKNKCHKHTIFCHLCHKEVQIDCPMIQVEEIIKSKTGFTFIEKEIKLRCICEECRMNQPLNERKEIEKWKVSKK
ncbi:Fur family transcriptional regulator [Clostridium ganghwense]|uniref:Fur family transcriptional regulator n=1 Tax=Clostridium ganghwense TaxID=312089 RepID=A0ABT4CPH1_9CLOT|nr:Fur family transcriptional regulator [Clostridium ganghwense]MCY6370960.1 Fur family transcriptional regulator [Clostridium ganghwense]